MIKQIKIGERELGFTFGPRGYIISNDECIHRVYKIDETADINTSTLPSIEHKPFTFQELLAIAADSAPLSMFDWVHYWGIKQRMAGNYNLLLRSMREIGISTDSMPQWGEDDRLKAEAA